MVKKKIEVNKENKARFLTNAFWSSGTGAHAGFYKLNILQVMAIVAAYAPYKHPDPRKDNSAIVTLQKLIQCNGIKHTDDFYDDSKKSCVRGLFLDDDTRIDKTDQDYEDSNQLYSVRIYL